MIRRIKRKAHKVREYPVSDKQRIRLNSIISFIMAVTMMLTAPFGGGTKVLADNTAESEDLDVTFTYTGGVQEWSAPYTGYYYVEAYGAAGGNDGSRGGYGGYVKMYTYLSKGTKLYIACGQKGWKQYSTEESADNPTYNGGGRAGKNCSAGAFSGVGGGATSIAITNRGELKNYVDNKDEVLMVAGGGAGGSSKSSGEGGTVLYTGSGDNYSVTNGASTALLNGTFALGSRPANGVDGGGGGGGWIGGVSGKDTAGNSAGGGASFVNISQNCIPIELIPDNNNGNGYVHITSTTYTGYYTISYDLDGGSATGNPISYSVQQDSFQVKEPTKTGFSFLGWTGSNGTTPQKEVTIEKGSTGNKSYKANWKVNQYMLDLNGYLDGTVQYSLKDYGTADLYINGVKVLSDVKDFNYKADYGSTYKVVIKPSVGKVLLSTTDLYMGDCGVKTLEGTINRTYTTSFYPRINTKTVKATFHRNISSSDTTTSTQTFKYGVEDQAFQSNTWKNDGYIFKGWTLSKNSKTVDYSDGAAVTDDWILQKYPSVDLYAVWEPITWTVKYDGNGAKDGKMADSKHTYNGGTYFSKNTFTRPGWTFVGWALSRERNGVTEWVYGNANGTWIGPESWYETGKNPAGTKLYVTQSDPQICQMDTYVNGDVQTAHAQWSYNPIQVKIPQTVIGSDKGTSQFKVSCDDMKAGSIAVTVPTSFSYTQSGKSNIAATISNKSGSNTISPSNKVCVYNITTESGLSAGNWQGSFNIGLTLTKE